MLFEGLAILNQKHECVFALVCHPGCVPVLLSFPKTCYVSRFNPDQGKVVTEDKMNNIQLNSIFKLTCLHEFKNVINACINYIHLLQMVKHNALVDYITNQQVTSDGPHLCLITTYLFVSVIVLISGAYWKSQAQSHTIQYIPFVCVCVCVL